jgi:hypothetical protein
MLLVTLLVAWEYVYPKEDELEYLNTKLKNFLDVRLRWSRDKSKERIIVYKEFSSEKLSALKRRGKASEFTFSYLLDLVKHGDLVGIVEAELSEGRLRLACISLSISSKRSYP